MKNKKGIIYIVASVLLIIITVIVACFLLPSQNKKTDEPIFSEHEEIVVNIENSDAAYFESIECIGKTKDEIKSEIQNAIFVSDTQIIMNNVINHNVNGSIEITLADGVVDNIIFKSNGIQSANDVDTIFKSIVQNIASSNNISEGNIVVVKQDFTEESYETPDVLFDTNNRLKCIYKISNVTKTIYTETVNGVYYVFILTE